MDAAERLLAMDNTTFAQVVDRELRGKAAAEESTALRNPLVAERWRVALVAIAKSVDGQLGARRADYMANRARFTKELLRVAYDERAALERSWAEQRENFNRSRAATLRFKSGLEETLIEANAIVNEAEAAAPGVRLWRFEHAPAELQKVAWNAKYADWLALIPATCVRGVDTYEDVDGVVRTNVQFAGGYMRLEILIEALDATQSPEYHVLHNGDVVAIGLHA